MIKNPVTQPVQLVVQKESKQDKISIWFIIGFGWVSNLISWCILLAETTTNRISVMIDWSCYENSIDHTCPAPLPSQGVLTVINWMYFLSLILVLYLSLRQIRSTIVSRRQKKLGIFIVAQTIIFLFFLLCQQLINIQLY